MRLRYRMENRTDAGKRVDQPMKGFQIPPPWASTLHPGDTGDPQLASLPSEEWAAHHWVFTMKKQDKNNCLEAGAVQSHSSGETSQQKDPWWRQWWGKAFSETDLVLITTYFNTQRQLQVQTETITPSTAKAEGDAGNGRLLHLGLLKNPSLECNSCLFVYIYNYLGWEKMHPTS